VLSTIKRHIKQFNNTWRYTVKKRLIAILYEGHSDILTDPVELATRLEDNEVAVYVNDALDFNGDLVNMVTTVVLPNLVSRVIGSGNVTDLTSVDDVMVMGVPRKAVYHLLGLPLPRKPDAAGRTQAANHGAVVCENNIFGKD
jgi:hypothetical protein